MIVEGSQNEPKLIDWNDHFQKTLKGELKEDVAQRTLGKFLMYNVGIAVRFLTGFRLFPDQRLMIKGWLFKNNSLSVMSRGASKCIDENAIVLTENGFKPIKEVEIGEKIWANKGLQEIEDKIVNPKERGFEIRTAAGYKCAGKIGHKILHFNPNTLDFEWKLIEDFKGDEIIPIRHGMNQWADKNPIEGFDPKTAAQARKLTLRHEPDFYYLLGLILGDGCLRGKPSTTSITSADIEVEEFLKRAVPTYIENTKVAKYPKQGTIAHSYDFNSKAFRNLLRYLGFSEEKAHKKVFPKALKGLNKAHMSAFLRGLFDTDGYATSSYEKDRNRWNCNLGFSSSSWDIIESVHDILLNYGIVSRIIKKNDAGPQLFSNGKIYHTNDAWSVEVGNESCIRLFSEQIGFGIKRKQDQVDLYLNNKGDRFDGFNQIPVRGYFRAKYRGAPFNKKYKSMAVGTLQALIDHKKLDTEDKRKIAALDGYYFDRIKTIKPIETVSIDIQVANESCYWSSGFINHNSWTFSHFCYLYCLFNPGKTVIMIAPNFRSSRKIVENIEKWALSKRGTMLKACIKPGTTGMLASKKPDVWSIEFKNGAKIFALPLGPDGESLRGYRASVIGVDEGLRIAKQIIDTVLKPFLFAIPEDETLRRQEIDEREYRLIKVGKMKPEEKTRWKSDAKMIILSSASYSWEDLFVIYKSYLKKIYATDEKMMGRLDETEKKKLAQDEEARAEVATGDDVPASYLVQQFSYKMLPPERIQSSIREEIESGMYSQSTIEREYEAKFVQDSDGYFSAKVMEMCTLHGASEPCAEIRGDPEAEYILGIDPNMAQSETSDHFAMCVIKIITKQTEGHAARKVGLVVHQYANAGAKLEHHINYLFYILRFFNIVYIACDTTQGDNADFINVCNESELFKTQKICLNPIEADFGKESFDALVEEIQRSYNKQDNRIVHKQYFHSAFQRAANEHLQASFNRRNILFPAKILDNPSALERMLNQGVGTIIDTHPDFAEAEGQPGNKHDFIEQQDTLVDLVKKECALIQVNVSSLGNLSYDLPQHIRRNKSSPARTRKDSYSALFLGNWALKLYLESKERPVEIHSGYYASWA